MASAGCWRRGVPGVPWKIQFRTLFLAGIAFGLVVRIIAFFRVLPDWDGPYYAALGDSFASGHEFSFQWGFPGSGFQPILSHHEAPLWPVVLATGYVLGGFSLNTTVVVSFVLSASLIAVVYATTRDLQGSSKGLFLAALWAMDFFLIELGTLGYSDNVVEVFYVLTIWAILRSLRDERYIILAGAFAGAGYLTRASVGYFFLLAGSLGFLWRFYYMRWGVFRNRNYLLAICIFASFVAMWAGRNVADFGWPHWENSPYTGGAVVYAFGRPVEFGLILVAKILLFLAFFLSVGIYFAPQLVASFHQYKEEETSAHLMAIGLPSVLGIIFASAFYLYEGQALWWIDNLRYVHVCYVPLFWLAFKNRPLPTNLEIRLPTGVRSAWRRSKRLTRRSAARILVVVLAGVIFLVVSHELGVLTFVGALVGSRANSMRPAAIVGLLLAVALTSVSVATAANYPAEYAAGAYLSRVARSGAVIAISGPVRIYDMYFALSRTNVTFEAWNGSAADFLLSKEPINASGYALLAGFNDTLVPRLLDEATNRASTALRSLLGMPRAVTPKIADLLLYKKVP